MRKRFILVAMAAGLIVSAEAEVGVPVRGPVGTLPAPERPVGRPVTTPRNLPILGERLSLAGTYRLDLAVTVKGVPIPIPSLGSKPSGFDEGAVSGDPVRYSWRVQQTYDPAAPHSLRLFISVNTIKNNAMFDQALAILNVADDGTPAKVTTTSMVAEARLMPKSPG